MKIHWMATIAKRKVPYCMNPKWKSLSSDPENVSCRVCVHKMIRMVGYTGNDAAGMYKFPAQEA